jgi:hypothetical protein
MNSNEMNEMKKMASDFGCQIISINSDADFEKVCAMLDPPMTGGNLSKLDRAYAEAGMERDPNGRITSAYHQNLSLGNVVYDCHFWVEVDGKIINDFTGRKRFPLWEMKKFIPYYMKIEGKDADKCIADAVRIQHEEIVQKYPAETTDLAIENYIKCHGTSFNGWQCVPNSIIQHYILTKQGKNAKICMGYVGCIRPDQKIAWEFGHPNLKPSDWKIEMTHSELKKVKDDRYGDRQRVELNNKGVHAPTRLCKDKKAEKWLKDWNKGIRPIVFDESVFEPYFDEEFSDDDCSDDDDAISICSYDDDVTDKLELPCVDGHFWIERDGKIIDPFFPKYDAIVSINGCDKNKQVWVEASPEIQREAIAEYTAYYRQETEIGEDKPFSEAVERILALSKLMNAPPIRAYNCFMNAMIEYNLRGGRLVFGSMGWERKGKSTWYEFGGIGGKYVTYQGFKKTGGSLFF